MRAKPINKYTEHMHIHSSKQMKGALGAEGRGEIYTADRVVVGVRVTITKIKSLLNHVMKVECKCDD